jgi:hypothetical protein
MKYVENAVLGALIRGQQFFDENGVTLTGVVDLDASRKRLDDVVTSFTTHALDQDVGNRGARGESAKGLAAARHAINIDAMRRGDLGIINGIPRY